MGSDAIGPWLAGAIVQRIERLAEAAFLISVRMPRTTVFLAAVGGKTPIVGPVDESARAHRMPIPPGASDGPLQRARRMLEGARVLSVRRGGDQRGPHVVLRRAGERAIILAGREVTFVLLPGPTEASVDGNGDSTSTPATDFDSTEASDIILTTESAALAQSATEGLQAYLSGLSEARRKQFAALMQTAIQKQARKLAKIDEDLRRVTGTDVLRSRAMLISSYANMIPRGTQSIELDDWSTGELCKVRVPLEPDRPAREQAEALFHRARRLERARDQVQIRRADAERVLERLRQIAEEAKHADDGALLVLRERARALGIAGPGPSSQSRGRGGRDTARRSPFHRFVSGKYPILVGRSAEDNDTLTTKIAKPHDLWLHVRGQTGSHVIVSLPKGQDCPPDVLIDAAHLAAHFSDARESDDVEIQYTPRRYLRKQRGSAPGAIVVDREKVLLLRKEPARLKRLLEANPEGNEKNHG